MAIKQQPYVHTEKIKTKGSLRKKLLIIIATLLLLGGGYLLFLTLSPELSQLPASIDLNTSDDENDPRDRIQIERIKLEVPFFSGDASQLEKGAWWRFPERGDPEKGGNFILSAHRFFLGKTPQGTRERSPFYKLNEIQPGDKVKVFYKNKWYEYEITKNYSVNPDAIRIEEPSVEPKLTLYTCSLAGSADGRVVIEGKPLFTKDSQIPPEEGSPLL